MKIRNQTIVHEVAFGVALPSTKNSKFVAFHFILKRCGVPSKAPRLTF